MGACHCPRDVPVPLRKGKNLEKGGAGGGEHGVRGQRPVYDLIKFCEQFVFYLGERVIDIAVVQIEGSAADVESYLEVDALTEQGKVLRRLINELRDDLFRYEGITVEDISDETVEEPFGEPGVEAGKGENPEVKAENGENPGAEAENGENPGAEAEKGTGKEADPDSEEAYYDTQSFQQGKVTLCVNEGTVKADTNVGGIIGTIATEYDLDPEDDITVTGAESFHIEQTLKAVVRESRNVGAVTGKKDYVGGIVGKADSGAVVSCEPYGEICSTGGRYVGGIVGSGCDVF